MNLDNDIKKRAGATPVNVTDRAIIAPGHTEFNTDMLPISTDKKPLQQTGSGLFMVAAVAVLGFLFFRSK